MSTKEAEDSRLLFLITTNEEPSTLDILNLQKHIEKIEARLSSINNAIAEANVGVAKAKAAVAQAAIAVIQAQAVVNSLKMRAQEEKDLLFQYCRPLAPIRHLPRDILIEIFLFTRDWSDKKDLFLRGYRPVGPRPGSHPFRIIQVCSEWRKVGLSVPMLWAMIKATYQFPVHEADRDTTGLRMWLERTGTTAPLDVSFKGPLNTRWEGELPRRMPLNWMHPYMSRIRHLSLEGRLCELPPGNFDSLETLRITGSTSLQRNPTNDEVRTAPLLRRVKIVFSFNRLHFIYWPHLTHLSLDLACSLRQSALLSMLSQCKSLVDLFIRCNIKDDDDDENDDNVTFEDDEDRGGEDVGEHEMVDRPIVMSLLASMTIYIGSHAVWLLSWLTLPSLSTLRIHVAGNGWSSAIYNSFCSRSSAPLHELEISGRGLSDEDFIHLLKETPSLVYVTASDAVFMTSTLTAGLVWDRPAHTPIPVIGPNLQRLSIANGMSSPDIPAALVETDTILQMISSRSLTDEPAVLVDASDWPSEVMIYRAQHPRRVSWNKEIKILQRNMFRIDSRRVMAVHMFF
ncbi:hypothetical protein Hypma_004885 [Hypsizygus marmoreus]|uniref:F-box domain-containing protein n=1 Tax=Hypsizygus marmoreus TaxID=39966 RepID=A0A369KIZ2_HYPMA|nr:hypothetical protein Hypma_004885 [Hypsizygus marmoreus]